MRVNNYCISLILLMLVAVKAYSQEARTEICVDFRVNSASFERGYGDNAERLSEIVSFLRRVEQDTTITLLEVSFCGSASPEGSYQYNHKLSRERLATLENIVRGEVDIPESIITRNESYISWDYLREKVEQSDMLRKQEVLDIIDSEQCLVEYYDDRLIDERIIKLRAIDGGRVWRQLYNTHFARMRNAYVVFITYKREEPLPVEEIVPEEEVEEKPVLEVETITVQQPEEQPEEVSAVVGEEWTRHLHLKTNVLGWGLLISNIAAEVDVAKHWSVSLPIYYSALNYFSPTVKFRTFAMQPEARYWLKDDNRGFFVGAHLGFAYYNLAVNGDLRYQDHDGKSPALGGGISVGYRLPITKNERWHMEFTLGAGVYGLHYDTFYNVPNGRLVDTHRKTYWGVDNASVGITYRFDLKKRKK